MAVGGSCAGVRELGSDVLLHPELLSRDFLLLSLGQKNIEVKEALNDKERLTEIFVQHAMPLPQRALPKSRWGKLMESKREQNKVTEPQTKSVSCEGVRKRPLIVFDGSSTSTSIKVKKTENGETAQRLQPSSMESTNTGSRNIGSPTSPPPHVCYSNLNRPAKFNTVSNNGHPENTVQSDKTLGSQQSTTGTAVKIKRVAPKDEPEVTNDLKPTEAKKKVIQHVTWP
ncbi:ashwin [Pelobates fuscus]|uniref:ashwin n=1 Tax=Pelobates fuscus TaxID=191477 RepID=UPI002FE4876E